MANERVQVLATSTGRRRKLKWAVAKVKDFHLLGQMSGLEAMPFWNAVKEGVREFDIVFFIEGNVMRCEYQSTLPKAWQWELKRANREIVENSYPLYESSVWRECSEELRRELAVRFMNIAMERID